MNAKDDHSYALSVIAAREREIHELRYAIMNIRHVLYMAGAKLPLNETSTVGLSTALAIVDAATLHLIRHDDMLVEPYPAYSHAIDHRFASKVDHVFAS